MFSEGGNEGWERFRKRQGKTLRKVLSKARELEKNKAKQIKRFGNVEVEEGMGAAYMPKAGTLGVPEREVTSKAVKKQLNRNRNRAQMQGDLETPHIRYTHSRDKSTDYIRPVKKKRIHNKKVKEESQQVNEISAKTLTSYRDKATKDMPRLRDKMYQPMGKDNANWKKNYNNLQRRKKGIATANQKLDKAIKEANKPNNPKLWASKKAAAKAKFDVYPSAYANGWAAKQYKAAGGTWRSEAVEYPADAHKDLNRIADKEKNTWWKSQDKAKVAAERETLKQKQDKKTTSTLAAHQKRMLDSARKSIAKKESFGDRGMSLQELGDPSKMTQLFRMGLAKKGELQLMQRMMKRGPDALKDPKLRQKMYDLLVDLTDLVTKDGQTFVKVRQNVQRNKKDLQAVKELLYYGGETILEVNTAYRLINIPEDMSGMSVSSGHKRSVDSGAGMTKKGVAAYRRRNPGSKLQTAVTTPPSKLKPGSKAAKRRKAFCSRSRSWTGERGKAARRRWNC